MYFRLSFWTVATAYISFLLASFELGTGLSSPGVMLTVALFGAIVGLALASIAGRVKRKTLLRGSAFIAWYNVKPARRGTHSSPKMDLHSSRSRFNECSGFVTNCVSRVNVRPWKFGRPDAATTTRDSTRLASYAAGQGGIYNPKKPNTAALDAGLFPCAVADASFWAAIHPGAEGGGSLHFRNSSPAQSR